MRSASASTRAVQPSPRPAVLRPEAIIVVSIASTDGAATAPRPTRPGAAAPTAGTVTGCSACGTIQLLPRSGDDARCPVCATALRHGRGTSLGATLALSATTLLLLVPANLLPIYRVDLLAASRESYLSSGVRLLWQEGFPLPAIAVLLFAILLPLARFALLAAALALVAAGRRPRLVGPMLRIAERLAIWAMPEVMLLGVWVAYGRLHALFALRFEAGGWCLAGAALASLLVRATLDRRALWRAVAPDRDPGAGAAISCRSCDLLVPADHAGGTCPRCAARLTPRATDSVARATALVLAGLVLYVPANLLPIAATDQLGAFLPYTVLKGVHDLIAAKLWGLAILVFGASFAIPLLKLAGMGWCLWSIRTRSRRHLRAKTRLFEVIHEIGRWSMVDIFAIATFVPLMQFGQLAGARAMPGASAFLMVVVLTMLATHAFDPRLMWDAAERSR